VAAILRGEKTATAGLLSDFEADGERLQEVGERFLVIDEQDREVAIIETTEVRVMTIAEVDLAFAHDEGEGFASVADWRTAHERFWLSYAPAGWQPTDATQIVCERFRLVETFDPADR